MDQGILTRYSASAGSGKTYKLTAIYLSGILKSPSGYRRILAVTFTHKAAADMKRKILTQLSMLAGGKRTPMDDFLISETGKSYEELSENASVILKNILHDYTWFSVGTIDSFFQRILRAFSREINLHQGYSVELDYSVILRTAVDMMISDSARDSELRRWLTEWSEMRIADSKSWNLREEILEQAQEVFREKFRLLPENERAKLKDRKFLGAYVAELKKLVYGFVTAARSEAAQCMQLLREEGVEDDMFYYGRRGGVPSFLRKMENLSPSALERPGPTVLKVLEDPPVWTSSKKSAPAQLNSAFTRGFDKKFSGFLRRYLDGFNEANSAVIVLNNIYTLGILSDILSNIHLVTADENKFLLSDAGELLFRITGNDQSPFIYEKIGTTYENYMIDEFQDTSLIQWRNFSPLISDSLASGNSNLVVGDLKQSIYRWRNSDWTIFGRLVEEETGYNRVKRENLGMNWRSKENIVAFNNTLFSILPSVIDDSGKYTSADLKVVSIFEEAYQDCPPGRKGGFVNISMINSEKEKDFRKDVLSRLPSLIESLQDKGYKGSDIGILVRKNSEGSEVLDALMNYKKNAGGKLSRYSYSIVSDESLLLANSPVISFIISLLEYSSGMKDDLSKVILLKNWAVISGTEDTLNELIVEGDCNSALGSLMPPLFTEFAESIGKMSLYTAVESVISFFSLGNIEGQSAFLSAFQDSVMEYSGSLSADIAGFLEWWETTGNSRTVILPEHRDSMKVMTIHKSKGLEFRIVIIPFINWTMGHSVPPLMWVETNSAPFDSLRMVPVKYASALENSLFADDFYSERFSAAIDNLNLLYVAFTRPVDGLYGFCPAKPGGNSVSYWLLQALSSEFQNNDNKLFINPSTCFSSANNEFRFGELPEADERDISEKGIIRMAPYCVEDSSGRLRLRFHGENWLTRLSEKREISINYGKLMHDIFSAIESIGDIQAVLKGLLTDGIIKQEDYPELKGRIEKALAGSPQNEWFKPGLNVVTENDILVPGKGNRRPDRVIVYKERTVVIDFKFGDQKSSHKAQVKDYVRLLESMGYPSVEGWLWYVDRDMAIKV